MFRRLPRAQVTKQYQEWDSLTAKFAGGANLPFLLLQLPQIILNSRNLLAGNKAALFAVPWLVRPHLPSHTSHPQFLIML
jgi:hypothetical protein